MMDPEKKRRLQAAGFEFLTVTELLGLTPEEEAIVEARVALAKLIRETREKNSMSQSDIAGRLKTSQSRVSKTEKADLSVSLDKLFKTALETGAGLGEIGHAISEAADSLGK